MRGCLSGHIGMTSE